MNKNENQSTKPDPTKDPFLIMITIIVVVAGIAKNWGRIMWAYELNCDKVFFAAYVGFLVLLYLKLKKNFDDSKEDRKSLLRLKRLRARESSRREENYRRESIPKNQFETPPLPTRSEERTTQSATTSPQITEIKIGNRLSDNYPVYLSDKKRTGHVQVLGATGRGKTESVVIPWMVQDFRYKRNSVILIDGKGDPEISSRFKEYAGEKNVLVFNPMDSRSSTINPLRFGTPQQITDRIMSSFEFQDPYYKAVQMEGLGTVVALITNSEKLVTFKKIDRALSNMDYLAKLSEESSDEGLKRRARGLITMKEDVRIGQFSGLRSQISPFVFGELALLVNGGGREISLSEILRIQTNRPPKAALILLPTLIYQEAARVIGRMCLQELAYGVGYRSSFFPDAPFTSVFLDEFSSFAYRGFELILNKARSANVALHLSHQSTGDLDAVSPEFARLLNTNTNIKCLLGLNDPDTADFFARHIGTRTVEKMTEKSIENKSWLSSGDEKTGMKSVREAESYKVHPNRLKNLTAGEGVIHIPTKPESVTEEIQFCDLHALAIEPITDEEVA